jgi:PmbA protein
MDPRDLAAELLRTARAAGASAADVLVAEGTEFSVTVRRGEVETLTEAGSKALGVRVFVGKRTATTHTSDFSWPTLRRLVGEAVGMARATGEDEAAGLPDEMVPPQAVDLGLFDPSPGALSTDERIERARRAEAAALEAPGIVNSQGASWGQGESCVILANTMGFLGGYRASSVSLSVVPQAERDGHMERDYWYTAGRGLTDLEPPEQVGRTAAERTLRRLGARQVPTCEVPVVFDPEAAAEILGTVFSAISGYAVFRNATFLKERLGEEVASPLLTLVDDGRRVRGLGSRPFDGEGLPTRRNVPIERGVLRHWLCDSYSARKVGARPTGSARRGVSGGPSVGASNLCFEPGTSPPEEIVGRVARGLYVTDLIGFGVNVVTGDYSQGAVGHWIEGGQLAHPVHEVTIAGNLREMLREVDAVGNDLVFRGSSASPTIRIRRMTVSGGPPSVRP